MSIELLAQSQKSHQARVSIFRWTGKLAGVVNYVCVGARLSSLGSFLGVESATLGRGLCSNQSAMRLANRSSARWIKHTFFFREELNVHTQTIQSHSDDNYISSWSRN